jgi:hypothetical protein
MISRRAILALITSIGTIAASGVALAKKQKKHQNGRALLGDNVKTNGKHKLHKGGQSRYLGGRQQWQDRRSQRRPPDQGQPASAQSEVAAKVGRHAASGNTSMRMAQASHW